MAIVVKPNQPVSFNIEENLCSTDTDYYTQIVDNADKTQFQIRIEPCEGAENLLPSPDFEDPDDYDLGDNWEIDYPLEGSKVCAGGVSLDPLKTTFDLDEDTYYKLTIEVLSINIGSEFEVYFGDTLVGSFVSSGTFDFYGFGSTSSAPTMPIIIQPVNASDKCCIGSLNLFYINTDVKFAIKNDSDITVAEFAYPADGGYFNLTQDSMTVTVDWAALDISNGCYYICLLDPCENTNGQNYPIFVFNCDFSEGSTGWTEGDLWGIDGGVMKFDYEPIFLTGDNVLTQSNVFTGNKTAGCVEINVASTSIPPQPFELEVYFGNNLVGTITTGGTHTICGLADGTDLKLVGGVGDFFLFQVCAVIPEYVCNLRSNLFKLGDYSGDCPETLLINACNNEDGLGFIFDGSNFSPRLRLQGKLKQAKYTADRVVETDSRGKKRVIYYTRRKQKQLVADLLPEYIHDFLSTLIGYDNVYINGTTYVVDDDEYNVTYDSSQDNVGSISMNVSERTQLVRNTSCGVDEQDCNIEGNYLLQADDLNQYILLVNGAKININE